MTPANEAAEALRQVLANLEDVQAQREAAIDDAMDRVRRAEQLMYEAELSLQWGGSRADYLDAELMFIQAQRDLVKAREGL